jgi:Protein of unknown function (DUF998)
MNTTSQHSNSDAANSMVTAESFAKPASPASPTVARWLALGAIAGPVLFTLAWIVLGFLSPGYTAWGTLIAPYSPIHQSISGLGLGPTAPFMNTVFVLCGLLLITGVVGIFQTIREIGTVARWICTVLLALTGLGMAMDGIFTLESFFLHFVGFGVGVGSLVLSFLVTGFVLRRVHRWRRFGNWLLLGSPLTLALLVLYFVTFSPTVAGTQTGVAGLTERILVVEVFAWFVALGWLAFRRS